MQREVNRLLDELAPEQTPAHAGRTVDAMQRHRTPNGCILQAPNAALSVTWYAEAAERGRVGELQVVLWRGTVARQGSRDRPEPAQLVAQEVLNPIERPTNAQTWRSNDGATYDTAELIAHCLALLDTQMKTAG